MIDRFVAAARDQSINIESLTTVLGGDDNLIQAAREVLAAFRMWHQAGNDEQTEFIITAIFPSLFKIDGRVYFTSICGFSLMSQAPGFRQAIARGLVDIDYRSFRDSICTPDDNTS